MAAWVENAEKRQEINDYFSSINCMSLRIIEDTEKVKQSYGKSWNKFSIKEQERKIDEWMVPVEVRKQYPLPEGEKAEIYPTLKLDTGQKIVELQNDQSEFPQTWMDEHSEPYSLQSRSQMDIRLPPANWKNAKKKSSLENNSLQNDEERQDFKDGGLDLGGSINRGANRPDKFALFGNGASDSSSAVSSKSHSQRDGQEKSDDFTVPDFNEDINLDFGVDLDSENYDKSFGTAGGKPSTKPGTKELPDISFGGDFFKSDYSARRSNDKVEIAESRALPSSGLSKAYEESEFLDLYPQPKEEHQKPAAHGIFGKMKESKPKTPKSRKNSGKKAPKLPENPPPKHHLNSPSANIIRPKKTHRKKSSSGSTQVNPRSSLTLDGAILNVEIAAEMNKQGTSPQISHEKVFGNEDELLKQIEKDTDFDSWLTDTQSQGSTLLSSKSGENDEDLPQVQKSGFDFLDSW